MKSIHTNQNSGSRGGGGGSSSIIISEALPPITAPIPPVPTVEQESKRNFTDVSDDRWSYKYTKTLFEEGIVSGISDEEFAPEREITRSEFIKMLVKALKLKDIDNTIDFAYVNETDWYYGACKSGYYFG